VDLSHPRVTVLFFKIVMVRLECIRCPWDLLWNKVSTIFGIISLHTKNKIWGKQK
jgi:hypothetical protein